MIVSPEQLKAINEAALQTYDTENIGTAQNTYNSINDKNNPALVNVQSGQNNPAAKSLTVRTTNGQVNPKDLTGIPDGTVKDITFSPISETKYSKRLVELARMLEMRKKGKVFSKKQLNEMFMETQENADRLRQGIGGCRLHDIFSAIEEFFPEEVEGVKEAFMNGADLPEYICSIFSRDSINGKKERAFLERLGI